jgi:hypothetical protein
VTPGDLFAWLFLLGFMAPAGVAVWACVISFIIQEVRDAKRKWACR